MILSPNRSHFGGSCATVRTNTLATLRGSIERIEAHGDTYRPDRVALGHADADATLQGGLAELGLDPRLLVTVRAADVDSALKTAADALVCDALGVVVLEVWGEARQLDLVASRKLTLAAQMSGVTGLVLRVAAEPLPSTAETRWIVRAAHSPPSAQPGSAWGAPVFDAQLVRNRHGPVGRWIMEWKCDECLFAKPAAVPQPVAAAPAHRPYQTPARARRAS